MKIILFIIPNCFVEIKNFFAVPRSLSFVMYYYLQPGAAYSNDLG